MGQPLMATPALAEGMLILRGENAIYAIGNLSGSLNKDPVQARPNPRL